jgi:hypothetical protein
MLNIFHQHRLSIIIATIYVILGFFIVWRITDQYGIGVSGDSISYISVADNLITGNGFLQIQDRIFTSWPPLYPIIIGVIGATFNLDYLLVARIISAGCFGLIVASGSLFVAY